MELLAVMLSDVFLEVSTINFERFVLPIPQARIWLRKVCAKKRVPGSFFSKSAFIKLRISSTQEHVDKKASNIELLSRLLKPVGLP